MVFNSDWLDGDVSRRELGDNDALHITQIEVEMGRMQNKKFIDLTTIGTTSDVSNGVSLQLSNQLGNNIKMAYAKSANSVY